MALKEGSAYSLVGQDHLGSTTTILTDAGGVSGSARYHAYGLTMSSEGGIPTEKKFTGQRLGGSDLYYYNARYYDPTIGRFISADPIVQVSPAQAGQRIAALTVSFMKPTLLVELSGNGGVNQRGLTNDGFGTGYTINPQELNRYSYVLNNPLRYLDSTGNGGEDTAMQAAGALVFIPGWGWAIFLGAGTVYVAVKVEQNTGALSSAAQKVGDALGKIGSAIGGLFGGGSSKGNGPKKSGNDGGGGNTFLQKAKQVADQIKNNGGNAPEGYKGGGVFENREGLLPKGVNYREYDINPFVSGSERGMERIVIGDDGSVYATDNHYASFLKIG